MRREQLPLELQNLLSILKCYNNVKFAPGESKTASEIIKGQAGAVECSLDEAQLVSSEFKDDFTFVGDEAHIVALDIDRQAWLIPSSTSGHSHLYVNLACSWEDYLNFLEAAAKIGLIEHGYYEASKAKGATYLRPPWVKKGHEQFVNVEQIEEFLDGEAS